MSRSGTTTATTTAIALMLVQFKLQPQKLYGAGVDQLNHTMNSSSAGADRLQLQQKALVQESINYKQK